MAQLLLTDGPADQRASLAREGAGPGGGASPHGVMRDTHVTSALEAAAESMGQGDLRARVETEVEPEAEAAGAEYPEEYVQKVARALEAVLAAGQAVGDGDLGTESCSVAVVAMQKELADYADFTHPRIQALCDSLAARVEELTHARDDGATVAMTRRHGCVPKILFDETYSPYSLTNFDHMLEANYNGWTFNRPIQLMDVRRCNRALACAARTLNAAGQSRVTLSRL